MNPGTLIVPTNAFNPSTRYDPPEDPSWFLKINYSDTPLFKPLSSSELSGQQPKMSSPTAPLFPEGTLPPITYKVPFYQVVDPELSFFEQWQQSPVYEVRRQTEYSFERSMDNTGNCEVGAEAALIDSRTVGTEISAGFSVNVGHTRSLEMTAGFAPIGIGGEATVGVSMSINFGVSAGIAKSDSHEKGYELPVPAGTAIGVFSIKSRYRIYRQGSDTPINGPEAVNTSPELIAADYRLPGWTKENGCPRSDVLLTGITDHGSEVSLMDGKPYRSSSGYHYLMLKDGDLKVYTDADEPIWPAREDAGVPFRIATVKLSQNGQITLSQAKVGGIMYAPVALVKDPNRPKGTLLYLTDDGVLQVVAPTGRVVWKNSKG